MSSDTYNIAIQQPFDFLKCHTYSWLIVSLALLFLKLVPLEHRPIQPVGVKLISCRRRNMGRYSLARQGSDDKVVRELAQERSGESIRLREICD